LTAAFDERSNGEMRGLLQDLAAQHRELDALVGDLGPDGWGSPTPCDGWDVRDVLAHLEQGDELARASLLGELDRSIETTMDHGAPGAVDAAADAGVVMARGRSDTEVLEHWRAMAASLRTALAGADPHARLQWVVGRLTARTLAATRLSECWIHTTDVATALGTGCAPTPRLVHVARLAWRTIPYAFAQAGLPEPGPVGFDLVGPDGAPWRFGLEDAPPTVVVGDGADLCAVAGRRMDPGDAAVRAEGPDAATVLRLLRTYA
jgi:uncharacterized protein (TIGR03084 family)